MSRHILRSEVSVTSLNARGSGHLPAWFGIEVVSIEPGRLRARLPIRPEMLAPNGFLHAATVIALADTSAGYATMAHLPVGADGFTTVELKTNFLGTLTEGVLLCTASLGAQRAHDAGLGCRSDRGGRAAAGAVSVHADGVVAEGRSYGAARSMSRCANAGNPGHARPRGIRLSQRSWLLAATPNDERSEEAPGGVAHCARKRFSMPTAR
jgi:1,4-dihydroxy-2-naphthoyl-CoA hydrolase